MAASKSTTRTASRTRRPASQPKFGAMYPTPQQHTAEQEHRLRQWAAQIVAHLPRNGHEARQVLRVAESLRALLMEGRRMMADKYDIGHNLVNAWAARIVADLPGGEEGKYVLAMARQLYDDYLPPLVVVPIDRALRDEIARRDAAAAAKPQRRTAR